jgi:hypothetical protein
MKEQFFAKLETLTAEARRLQRHGFDEQELEEATKQLLIEPLLQALGFTSDSHYTREFKILSDTVDYLLKSDRPLMFEKGSNHNFTLFDLTLRWALGHSHADAAQTQNRVPRSHLPRHESCGRQRGHLSG